MVPGGSPAGETFIFPTAQEPTKRAITIMMMGSWESETREANRLRHINNKQQHPTSTAGASQTTRESSSSITLIHKRGRRAGMS
jgi:hypothetical protein